MYATVSYISLDLLNSLGCCCCCCFIVAVVAPLASAVGELCPFESPAIVTYIFSQRQIPYSPMPQRRSSVTDRSII